MPEGAAFEPFGLVYQVNDAWWANCGLSEETLSQFDQRMAEAAENGVAPHVEVVREPAAA